jgi:tryptophan halogenase
MNRIVIVGGGTAGWLAALMISKVYKNAFEITLIESDTIKTIGVGEGSTGFLRGVINNELWEYGCNEVDFMKHVSATPKLGILFKEWTGLNEEYMEPIDVPLNGASIGSSPLLSFLHSSSKDISLSSVNGRLIDQNLSPLYMDTFGMQGTDQHAHHFDSHKAAEYFEKICGKDVTKVVDTIDNIHLDNEGYVASLSLSSGKKLEGDFFIDASGLRRIFSKPLNVNFIEYSELSLDSAIPFRMESSFFGDPFFYTVSWAQKYGWMWMIPRADSVGCGYIYDSSYISEQEAKAEIEEKLGTTIDVVKNIKFKAGRLEKVWNKNVLFIGLSSNFLEPLEATSIHGTIAQLNNFIFNYLSPSILETITEENIAIYNQQTADMVDAFRDFILLHYAGTRQDTDFWKKINISALENTTIKKLLDISKHRLLVPTDMYIPYGGAAAEMFNWVLVGLNHFSKDTATKSMKKPNQLDLAKKEESSLVKVLLSKPWLTNQQVLDYLSTNS